MTKSEVIKMLKEMQVETAQTIGFFAGHVTQAWVINSLLGSKIAELEGEGKEAERLREKGGVNEGKGTL